MARKSFVTPIIIIEWSVLSFFSVLHCWKSSGTRSTVELAPSYQLLHIPPTLPFLNSNSYGSRVIPMNQSHLHVFPIFVKSSCFLALTRYMCAPAVFAYSLASSEVLFCTFIERWHRVFIIRCRRWCHEVWITTPRCKKHEHQSFPP